MCPNYRFEETEKRNPDPVRDHQMVERAHALVSVARDEPPALVLDRPMHTYCAPEAVGARDGSVLDGLGTMQQSVRGGTHQTRVHGSGYMVTMRAQSQHAGPRTLYVSP